MSEKHEHISGPRCFYAFVDLKVPAEHVPVTYIIPSQVVADVLKGSHETWLKTPGRGGRAHRTNPVRQVLPVYGFPMPDKYQEGWMESTGSAGTSCGQRSTNTMSDARPQARTALGHA